MDRTLLVRTPESIAFSYELAGVGSRFLAVGIDLLLQITAVIVLLVVSAAALPHIKLLLRSARLSGRAAFSLYEGLLIIVLFAILFGYFIAFEALWNGQTPGKRLIGIRVVRDGGYPIALIDSLIRNLIRVVEVGVGFYIASVISMLVSAHNKRLGDLAAGTIVVRDHPYETASLSRGWDTQVAQAGAPNFSARALSPAEVSLARRYVTRRVSLNGESARSLAAKIAATLRPKLGPAAATLDDDELLRRVAAGLEL
ncbi:MAG: RDD family protein [Candidatus Eremiobacteraeota bacterium]|nr:RDD family protein [Candidatus Eremiobacteraeota bacterium]MBC5827083.1 RDD family protein [Candidatus Eremiobacteraeota bacterium]